MVFHEFQSYYDEVKEFPASSSFSMPVLNFTWNGMQSKKARRRWLYKICNDQRGLKWTNVYQMQA